jgi:hypothetical protein
MPHIAKFETKKRIQNFILAVYIIMSRKVLSPNSDRKIKMKDCVKPAPKSLLTSLFSALTKLMFTQLYKPLVVFKVQFVLFYVMFTQSY